MLSALLSCVAVHQVHAQNNAPIFNWQGEVQVSASTLTIREGETISYAIRLSEQPSADGWWVRIHVDGVVYTDGRLDEKGVRWVPSVGWEFNREGSSGPTQWRNVHITAFQDDDDDKDEFVTITHEVWDENSNCPPSLHGVAPVEVQVTDDESASTGVALSVNPMTVSEGAGGTPVTVRAALNGAARLGSTPVKVAVGRTGDSATEGTDYETVDDLTVTIPAGLTSATERFTLTPTDDVVVESDKTVTVSGTTTVSGITTINPATLTIEDDDVPPDTIELRVSPASVAENAGATQITVTAAFLQGSATLSTPTVVNVTLAAATAQAADFTPVQPFNVTIPASAGSGTATFQFTPNDDTSMEGSETVTVSGTTTASSITTVNPATLTIIDNDAPPDTIELRVSPASVAENAGETDIMVTAAFPQGSATLSTPTVVNVTLTAATAQAADFTPVQPFDITIPASAASGTATFQFTPNDDTSMEGSETVILSGTTTASSITTINPATLTITDDETPNNPPTGQPRITGTARVGQTLTAVTTDIQDADGLGDFAYQWKADGTNIAGAIDSSYTLTNNEVGKRITVTVSFTDGIGTEETVTSQPTVAVKDAVTPPPPALTVAFDPASYSTTEGGDPVTVRVTLNRTSDQDVTIPITVMPQGATEADDYTVSGLTDGTLSFAPGDLSKTFMIVANEDTDSDDETIELGFGTLPEGVSKGEMATATLTITDNVPPDTIELRVSPASVAENAGATQITVTAAFLQGSATLSTPTVVNVTLAAATAQAADFTPVQPFNVTIPASAGSGTATFQFTPNDDTSMEGSETVTVSGTTTASSITTVNPATLTIIDNDAPPDTIELRVSPASVAENAGETDIMVTAAFPQGSATLSTPTVVNVTLTAATAQAADFTPVQPFDITIPASAASGTATFQFTPNDDTSMEGSETVILSGTTTASSITTINPATLTITDDETPNNPPTGQPRITGTARVGQTLTAVTTDIQDADGLGDFAYQWKADGTNIAGAIDSSYTLTNNEVGKRITVTVSFTDGIGTEETVTSQPTVAVKDAVTPPPPALTVAFDPASYSTTEGGDPVTVRVTLNRTSDQDVTIPITVMPQGATEADDYTVSGLTDGTLSFAPGDLSKTFMIVANEDTDSDDETIELGFGTLPEGVSKGEMATATLTITDNVPPDTIELRVSFARAEHRVAEGGEPASINVNISPAADRRVEVSLVVTPQGGATSQDYDGVPASIVFEVGATVVTLQVAALADQENDPGESLVLGFGDLPEAVRAGDPSETTVKFTQQRSAEQFSASLKIMLAVVARSVAESAQTAIQSRFQRKRQLMRAKQSARGPNAGGSLSAGQAGSNGSSLSRTGALNHIPEADRFGFAPPRLDEGTGPSLGSVRSGSLHNALVPDYGIAPTRAAYGYDPLQRTSTVDPSLVAHQFSGIRARQPILSQASFNFHMGESTKSQDGNGSVTLWGQGDLQNFNGNITRSGMDYRGLMRAAHVGLDLYNSEQMLVGFSFMRSWAGMNYNADGVHGMLGNGMNTAHPYLYWQPNERFSAWVIGGLGRGEVDVNEPGRTHVLTADFRMFSGGMRSVLAKRGNTEVGVVVDSFTARLETNASEDIERVRGQVSRTRMMLEMVHDKPLAAGRSLSIKAEFGSRHDEGDADRGSGAEAGFRLGFLDAASGLDIAWHGRVLLVHESDYRDFGVGMQVSWDPGKKRRGLQLSMMSSRGQDGGGRTTLWNNSALVTRPMGSGYMPNASQTSTSGEVAYGMDIFGGRGLLTPYSRLQLAGYGRDLRVGTELSLLSRWLPALPAKFQLEGIRRETPNGMIDLGMMLGISIPF